MNLTKRERAILQLAKQGLSDYKIARKLKTDPPSVTRSRKNAQNKVYQIINDIEWVSKNRFTLPLFKEELTDCVETYPFFL
jgi:DNA-binding NarL/FixJ family response regulator